MNTDFRFSNAYVLKRIGIICILSVMIIYVILIVYPLFNMIISSLKPTREILQHPFALLQKPDFSSYKKVFPSGWVSDGSGDGAGRPEGHRPRGLRRRPSGQARQTVPFTSRRTSFPRAPTRGSITTPPPRPSWRFWSATRRCRTTWSTTFLYLITYGTD